MAKSRKKSRHKSNSPKGKAAASPQRVSSASLQFLSAPGDEANFKNASTSQVTDDSASCVRELIQNSLDAALVDMGEEKAKIRFTVEKINMGDIPGMSEYRSAAQAAVKERDTNYQTEDVVSEITESYNQESVEVLFIADNGYGFDKERLATVLGDGGSLKGNEGSSGAFGYGHFTTFALSRLRYVFYSGVLSSGETTYAGHAILASHIKNGRTYGKDGYFVKGIVDGKRGHERFKFGEKRDLPSFLKPHMEQIQEEWGHGALVAVVSFNRFGGEDDVSDVILREAASNFFVAISRGALEVEVVEKGVANKITEANLRAMLEKQKENKRSKRKGFPSGSRIWRVFETLKEGDLHTIKTGHGEVAAYLREKSDGRRVAICRNGMWITGDIPSLRAHDFADRVGFDALLLVDHQHSGEAHDLLKLAETPLHNEIERKNIKSEDKKKKLGEVLRKIRDGIKGLVSEKNEDSFDPGIFPIEIAGAIDGGQKQQPRGEINPMSGGGSGGKSGKSKGTNKKNPRISSSGKVVNVRTSICRVKSGTLSAVFLPQDDYDNVEMQLLLDGGKDVTCAGSEDAIVPIENIAVEGHSIGTGAVNSVRLGRWEKGKKFRVDIEYQAPVGEREYALKLNFVSRKAESQNNKQGQENV